MKHRINLAAAAATSLSLALPAHAEVTAAEVWAGWQELLNSFGLSTSVGTATESGDRLTITDFGVSMDMPEGTFSQTIAEVVFTNQGDGTVAITMSPQYPIMVSADPGTGDPFSMELNVSQDGLELIASGDAETTRYDFSANSLAIAIENMMEDGEAIPLVMNATIDGVSGNYILSGSGDRAFSELVNADSARISFSVEEDGDDVSFDMGVETLQVNARGTFPESGAFMAGDMAAALNEGLEIEANYAYGPASYDMDIDADGEQAKIVGSANGGTLDVLMSEAGLGYGGSSTGVQFSISGSEIPFPEVSIAMAETGFDLLMPISKSEEPEDFKLAFNITDFTIGDMIWAMFDPAQNLPRDPATLAVDLTGKANLFFDLMDPEQAAEIENEVPGELHAVTLNGLTLSAAGALLTGSGDFTFDNSDLVTFAGMPAPTGEVDMKLVGGNGLIDKLVGMGLLPEEQAMGARMMLGLFARPGDGEDTLVSKIEVKGDGSVSANGQRLR